jgi:hypothetical protein
MAGAEISFSRLIIAGAAYSTRPLVTVPARSAFTDRLASAGIPYEIAVCDMATLNWAAFSWAHLAACIIRALTDSLLAARLSENARETAKKYTGESNSFMKLKNITIEKVSNVAVILTAVALISNICV